MSPDIQHLLPASLDDIRKSLNKSAGDEVIASLDKALKQEWIFELLYILNYDALAREDKGVVRQYIQRETGYSRAQTARLIRAGTQYACERAEQEVLEAKQAQQNLEEIVVQHKSHKRVLTLHNIFAGAVTAFMLTLLVQWGAGDQGALKFLNANTSVQWHLQDNGESLNTTFTEVKSSLVRTVSGGVAYPLFVQQEELQYSGTVLASYKRSASTEISDLTQLIEQRDDDGLLTFFTSGIVTADIHIAIPEQVTGPRILELDGATATQVPSQTQIRGMTTAQDQRESTFWKLFKSVNNRRESRLASVPEEERTQVLHTSAPTTDSQLFASAPSVFDNFGNGTNGQVLMMVDGVPQWTFINESNVQELTSGYLSRRGGGSGRGGGGGGGGSTGATGADGAQGPAGPAGADGAAGPTLGIYNSLILESSGNLAAGNASGQNLFNLGLLTASGQLIVEDNVRFNSGVILNGVTYNFPEGDGSSSGKVLKTDGNGNLVWSTDAGAGGGTVEYAGRGLSKDGNNFISLNATITGSLVNFVAVSGATVSASDLLTASGQLIVEGEATFGSGLIINGVTYRFPLGDGSASGKVLKTDSNGNLSWSDDNDSGSLSAGQGITIAGGLVTLNSSISGSLANFTTLSGATIAAQNFLASSGALSVEGVTTLNDEVVFGSGLIINGVTYRFPSSDGSASGKVLATDGNGNLSWTTAAATGSFSGTGSLQAFFDNRYVNTSGDTMTGALVINPTTGDIALEASAIISGTTLRANDLLTSSGTLIVEGATTLNSTLAVAGLTTFAASITGTDAVFSGTVSGSSLYAVTSLNSSGTLNVEGDTAIHGTLSGNTIAGFNLTDCQGSSNKLVYNAASQRFECATDQNTGQTYTAGQGLTEASNVFSLNTTITGSLVNFTTVSGATVTAGDFLASSGALSVEGTSTLNGAVTLGSTITINGVTYTFPFGDGSATGKVLKTDGAGNLSWSDDTDTNTDTTFSGTGSLQAFFDNRYVNTSGDTMTGALTINPTTGDIALEASAIISGTTLRANDLLTSSGAAIIEGNLTVNGSSALQGVTATTIIATLVEAQTLSGATIRAQDFLASSGALSIEGTSTLNGAVTLGSTITINGVTYTFPFGDGSATGKVLKTDGAGNLSWSDDTDTNTDTTFSGTGSLQAFFDSRYVNTAGDTMTGALTINPTTSTAEGDLQVAGLISGSTLHVEDKITSSGELIIDASITIGTGSLWQPVYVSTEDLVGYWPLSESGSSVAYDFSSKAHESTITGATWAAGKYGSALSFNGSSDYVDIGQPFDNYGQMTVCAWVQNDSISAADYVVSQRGGEGDGWWELIGRDDGYQFEVKNTSGQNYNSPEFKVSDTNWHHICGTFDNVSNKVALFGDGKFLGTSNTTGTPAPTVSAAIGAISATSPVLFGSVTVDDVRLYNRVLTVDEVRSLYVSTENSGFVRSNNFRILTTENTSVLRVSSGGDLTAIGFVSGATVRAQNLLTSSGGLVIEGAATFNDEVTFGSGLIINGVTYRFPSSDGSASGKVLATDSNGNLSWTDGGGTDTTFSGTGSLQAFFDNRYVNTSGDTMTGALVIINQGVGDDADLEVIGIISGSIIHAQDTLTSSGGLIVEGNIESFGSVTLHGNLTGNTLTGFGLTNCTGGSKLLWNSTTQAFECGVDQSAGSGLDQNSGDARYVEIAGDTMTGALIINPETGDIALEATAIISGTHLHAQDLLTASGDIVTDGDIYVNGDTKYLRFRGTAGGGGQGVVYTTTDGLDRYALFFPGNNVVALGNRGADGVVQIRANSASAGSAGEVTTAQFEDTEINFYVPASGSVFHAEDLITSSGALVIEGTATFNDEVTFGSGIIINGVTYRFPLGDGSATGKVLKTDGNGNLSWSDDNNTGTTYEAGQGLSLNGSVFSLSAVHSGTTIEATTLLSGATVHGQNSVTSSGTLVAEGNLTINGSSALQGVTATTIIATLVEAQTLSGATIRAQDFLASSGALSIEGTSTLNGAVTFGSTITINGVTYTFPFGDGSATGKVLKTDGAGNLSWSDDTDTNTDTTFSGTGSLQAFFDSRYVNTAGDTMTGALTINPTTGDIALEASATISGTVLHAQDHVSVSGSVVIDSLQQPEIIGTLTDATNLAGVLGQDLAWPYLYAVSRTDDSLQVIDISDPGSPTIVGELDDATNLSGPVTVKVVGDYAYIVARDGDDFRIVDVSNPSSPVLVGGHQFGSTADLTGLDIAGNYAYVADSGLDSIYIFDIADPTNPVLINTVTDATYLNGAYELDVVGRYAYVAAFFYDGLAIYDIGNPRQVSRVGAVQDLNSTLAGAINVEVVGRYAYVSAFDNDSMRIIDVSDPSAPSVVGGILNNITLNQPYDIDISGNYAYIASTAGDSITIVDISDASSPVQVGIIQDATTLNGARDLTIHGRYAYVSARDFNTIQVIDLGGFETPTANIGDLNAGSLDVAYDTRLRADLTVDGAAILGDDVRIDGLTTIKSASGLGLRVIGTASGQTVYADDLLASSGALSVNGDSFLDGEVTFGSGIIINGVTYRFPSSDGSASGKVLATDSNGNLSWTDGGGTDTVFSGTGSLQVFFDNRYVNTSGDTMTGALVINPTTGDIALEASAIISGSHLRANDLLTSSGGLIIEGSTVLNGTLTVAGLTTFNANVVGTTIEATTLLSGALVHAQDTLSSSGSLQVEGAANIHGTLSGNTIVGFNLTDCDNATTSKLLWDATTQRFSCGSDQGGSNAPQAGQGLSLDGNNFFSLNTTISGSLVDFTTISGATVSAENSLTSSGTIVGEGNLTINGSSALQGVTATTIIATLVEAQTLSGATIRAQDFLASSGALSVEGTSTLNGAVTFGSTVTINGVTYTFPFGDGSATGKVLKTDGAGNLSWSDDTDTNTTYSEGQGLTLNSSVFSLSAVHTGTTIEATTLLSGALVHAQNGLTASGAVHVDAITPVLAGSIVDATNLTNAAEVEVVGDYAYVVNRTNDSLRIINISNPASPSIVGGVADASLLNGAFGVRVSGRYAYVVGFDGDIFTVVDIANPSAPVILGSVSSSTSLNQVRDLDIAGQYAYIAADGTNDFSVIDISDPLNPVIVYSTALSAGAYTVEVEGRYAYLKLGSVFISMDISDPLNPFVLDSVAVGSNTSRIAVVGNYAYVPSFTSSQLAIIDISNPAAMTIADTVSGLGSAISVDVAGDFAYVAAYGDNAITVVDVSDPTNAVELQSFVDGTNLGGAHDIKIAGRYAYAVGYLSSSLAIIDLGGLEAHNANVGSLAVETLNVLDGARINENLLVDGYANIGNGINVQGNSIIRSLSGTSLKVLGTLSGSTVHADDLLASSGALAVNGASYLDGAVTFGSTVTINGVTYTFPVGDGSASGKVLATNSAGQLSWTDGGGTDTVFSGTGSLQSFFDNRYVQVAGDTMTGGLLIHSTNNPSATVDVNILLEVAGAMSGWSIHAQNQLTSSGTLTVESSTKVGSGAVEVTAAEFQTGAYLFASGADVLALSNYDRTSSGTNAHITFGYLGAFDVDLYREGTYQSGGLVILTQQRHEETSAFRVVTNWKQDENTVFRVAADGALRTSSGATFSGSLVPYADDLMDLGSTSNRWRDLYLGPATIHVGSEGDEGTISYDTTDNYLVVSNSLEVPGALSGRNLYAQDSLSVSGSLVVEGNVTFNGGVTSFTGITSGSHLHAEDLLTSSGAAIIEGSLTVNSDSALQGVTATTLIATLVEAQTLSGATIRAQDFLASSGALSVEGTSTLNGAVTLGSTIAINGVTYTFPFGDGSATGKVLKTDGAGNLSWSDDTDTNTDTTFSGTGSLQAFFDSRYVNTAGDTMTGALTINPTTGDIALEASAIISGTTLRANDLLTSSGAAIIEGSLTVNSDSALQGVTATTLIATLVEAQTLSGATIRAQDFLASSGALSIEGTSTLNGAVTLGSTLTVNSVTYTFPLGDGSATGKVLKTDGAGNLSWSDDTDTNTDTTFSGTGSLQAFFDNRYVEVGGDTMTGALTILNSGNVNALNLQVAATTGDIFTLSGSSLTSGTAFQIPNLNALTTGSGIYVGSTSTALTSGKLFNIVHDATSASLSTKTDALASITSTRHATSVDPQDVFDLLSLKRVNQASNSTTYTTSGSVLRIENSVVGTIDDSNVDTTRGLEILMSYDGPNQGQGDALFIDNNNSVGSQSIRVLHGNFLADAVSVTVDSASYNQDVMQLSTNEEDNASFNFLNLISDADGTPDTELTIDQSGNIATDGTLGVGIGGGATPDTQLEVVGVISGSQVYAADLLRSSGALVIEGNATFNSTITIGGVTYTFPVGDGSASGKVLKTDGAGNLSWSDDNNDGGGGGLSQSSGDARYVNISGDTMTGALVINPATGNIALEAIGIISGSALHIEDLLTSSGDILLDGAMHINGGTVTTNYSIDADDFTIEGSGQAGMSIFGPTTQRIRFGDATDTTRSLISSSTNGLLLASTTSNGSVSLGYGASGTEGVRLDSTGNFGIGTTSPSTKLEVVGIMSGSQVYATDMLRSSGSLIVESSVKRGSGAVVITAAEFQTGAYLYSSGTDVLAINSYLGTQSGANAHIAFGYLNTFDVRLFRSGAADGGSGGLVLKTNQTSEDATAFKIMTDYGSAYNDVFRVSASGAVHADGAYNSNGADYAEWFMSRDDVENGEVVCIDVTRNNQVMRCTDEADANVMGIVSSNPAFIGNKITGAGGIMPPGYELIGLIGQVPTKVLIAPYQGSVLNIHPGDALTPAATPGYARRALPGEPTVGVALEAFSGSEGDKGTVNVLISRRNSSVTVDTVEQEVLDQIAAMEIEDEVEIMVADAVKAIDYSDDILTAVRQQIDTIDIEDIVNNLLADRFGTGVLVGATTTENTPEVTVDWETLLDAIRGEMNALSTEVSTLSGAIATQERDANFDTVGIEDNLIIGGDARAASDFYVDGTLHVEDLFIPGLVTLDGSLSVGGDVDVGGRFTANALTINSGATVRGPLTIDGKLMIDGKELDLSGLAGTGGFLNLSNLLVQNALHVMGDITIEGMADILGDVNVGGNLTVSGALIINENQAGYAVIVESGTGVNVRFGSGTFPSIPLVTASSDSFIPWRIRNTTGTGFTIEVQEPADEDITFTWHAMLTHEPSTFKGLPAGVTNSDNAFPVDQYGVPVSSSDIWNACIRSQQPLGLDGQPFNCRRYHDGEGIWTHVDLNIEFTWDPNNERGARLEIPEGYYLEVVVSDEIEKADEPLLQGESSSSSTSSSASSEPESSASASSESTSSEEVSSETSDTSSSSSSASSEPESSASASSESTSSEEVSSAASESSVTDSETSDTSSSSSSASSEPESSASASSESTSSEQVSSETSSSSVSSTPVSSSSSSVVSEPVETPVQTPAEPVVE